MKKLIILVVLIQLFCGAVFSEGVEHSVDKEESQSKIQESEEKKIYRYVNFSNIEYGYQTIWTIGVKDLDFDPGFDVSSNDTMYRVNEKNRRLIKYSILPALENDYGTIIQFVRYGDSVESSYVISKEEFMKYLDEKL